MRLFLVLHIVDFYLPHEGLREERFLLTLSQRVSTVAGMAWHSQRLSLWKWQSVVVAIPVAVGQKTESRTR